MADGMSSSPFEVLRPAFAPEAANRRAERTQRKAFEANRACVVDLFFLSEAECPGLSGSDRASYAPDGRLAQLVEQLLYTQRVGGSSPSPPTIIPR